MTALTTTTKFVNTLKTKVLWKLWNQVFVLLRQGAYLKIQQKDTYKEYWSFRECFVEFEFVGYGIDSMPYGKKKTITRDNMIRLIKQTNPSILRDFVNKNYC